MGEFVVHGPQKVDRVAGVPVEKVARDLDYETPERILACVRTFFGGRIPLDPATSRWNPTDARLFIAPPQDGLIMKWWRVLELEDHPKPGVWLNPPYGRQLRAWLEKVRAEASSGLQNLLVLAPVSRTEQEWAQAWLARAHAVCLLRGRVAFLRPTTASVDPWTCSTTISPEARAAALAQRVRASGNPYASALFGFNVDESAFATAFSPLGRCFNLKEVTL